MLSYRRLFFAISAVLIAAACEAETDTEDTAPTPAPEAPASVDRPAPAPAPTPSPDDAEPSPPAAQPDDGAADTPAPPNPPASAIPTAYRGRWDRSAAACAQASSVMRLNVGSGQIRFYEGTSRVLAVRDVNGAIEVAVEHTAEGSTERRTYRLSTTGDQLTVTIGGHATTRVRCG